MSARAWILSAGLACLAVRVAALAATPAGTADQLRQLLRLPRPEVAQGCVWDLFEGFEVFAEERPGGEKAADSLPEGRAVALYQSALRLKERGEAEAAVKLLRMAAEMLDRQVQLRPGQASLWVASGNVAWASGDLERAEREFRRAIAERPAFAPGWIQCARLLGARAIGALSGEVPLPHQAWGTERVRRADANRVAQSAEVSRAQQWLDEAGALLNRALEAGAEKERIQFERGLHKSRAALIDELLRRSRGDQAPRSASAPPEMTEAAVEDFREAALGGGSRPWMVGNWVLFAVCHSGAAIGEGRSAWPWLSGEVEGAVRTGMVLLDRMAGGWDRSAAVESMETRGILQRLVYGDRQGAEESFRLALEREPGRARSWQWLASGLAESGRHEELLRLCARSDALGGKVPVHVWTTIAQYGLGRSEEAEWELRSRLRTHAGDFWANLGLGALLLKRDDYPEVLGEVNSFLMRAGQTKGRTRQETIEWILVVSIYHACAGNLSEARKLVNQVRQMDPGNTYAAAIATALP